MTVMTNETQKQTISFELGGKQVTFETGELAKSASGSVVLRCEDTVLLVTATASSEPRPGIDFFPLLVDYEEKMFCVGRLPGGFIKREGRPSEKAVLTCRLIDRPIRPLWPDGYKNDVQVVAQPLSADGENQIDVLAILGASMALELGGLPFLGPVGAVRVGKINGEFVINPTYQQSNESSLDLVVAGTEDSIMMVEAGGDFIPEDEMIEAIALAHDEIKKQTRLQESFRAQCGVEKTEFALPPEISGPLEQLSQFVGSVASDDVFKAYHEFDRDTRKEMLQAVKEKLKAELESKPEEDPIRVFLAEHQIDYLAETFKKLEKKIMRAMVMEEGLRADGRTKEEIRPISSKVGLLPRAHGTGLFTRGSTQVLSVCTLGSPGDAQELDGVDPAREKRWIHHYAFPGYSVGEVKPMRGPGRREIGHGALAERAIQPSLPIKEDFAYTLRVNSEVLESNGSTSMASTCGASLALMDAGVPVKTPIGGIAMGLIKEGADYVVLSDIQGIEDFLGDMDFKVAGNREGITALQMDIKIQGISIEIMRIALEQAHRGRLHILDKMAEAIAEPKSTLSEWAPRIITMRIETDQIGTVIGPGGKTVRGIIEETGVNIDIEDDGLITITCPQGGKAELAQEMIEQLTLKIEPGLLTLGSVVRIIPVGAFVELSPGKDGMVHISQLVHRRVEKVDDVVSVGDEVVVKVLGIDERGRVSLTMKGVSDEERAQFGYPPHPPGKTTEVAVETDAPPEIAESEGLEKIDTPPHRLKESFHDTPLAGALTQYPEGKRRRFHVPGHGGRFLSNTHREFFGSGCLLDYDLTELDGLDVLSEPDGCIAEAQAKAAESVGAAHGFFLVNGASIGIQAAMLATLRPGDEVLIPRNVHRSVLSGLILTDASPVWFLPQSLEQFGLWGKVNPQTVEQLFKTCPQAKALILSSPTYEGIGSDIGALSSLCKSQGVFLIVDEAHGSLWPYHNDLPVSACSQGADVVIHSLHKTGGSLTQSAVSYLPQGSFIHPHQFQQALNTLQSTSPSYLLLASLDLARQYLESDPGHQRIDFLLSQTVWLRNQLETLESFQPFKFSDKKHWDPTKLYITCPFEKGEGWGVRMELKRRIAFEATSPYGVLYLMGLGLEAEDYSFFLNAFQSEDQALSRQGLKPSSFPPFENIFPLPQSELSPRDAFFAPGEEIPSIEAVGRIAKETVVHCPPGIPVIMPGEVVQPAHLEFLTKSLWVVS